MMITVVNRERRKAYTATSRAELHAVACDVWRTDLGEVYPPDEIAIFDMLNNLRNQGYEIMEGDLHD